jgi:imidazolonepropionase-like amidohydrolase
MRLLKLLAVVLFVLVVGAGGYLAKTVKRVTWRPLVKRGASEPLVFTNVRVFTATDAGVLEAQQVVVADGKIVSVGAPGAEVKGRVIDGAGKTLLPGLIDAHVHLFNTASPPWYLALPDGKHTLEAYLYSGVTSVVSMGDDWKQMDAANARLKSGAYAGPRIAWAGSPITRTGGHPQASRNELVPRLLSPAIPDFGEEIETPEQADGVVAKMVSHGATFVKVVVDDLPGGMPRLEEAHLRAIVEAAHQRGIKAVAHVGTAEDAMLAVKAGIDGLNHMPNLGPMSDAQVATLKLAGIPVVPTMIIFERASQMSESHYVFGELDRAIEAPEILEQLGDETCAKNNPHPFLGKWLAQMAKARPDRAASVKAMSAAGIPLFVGTDSSIIGNVAGASIHAELKLLVASGVPPHDALLGATVLPARFFFPNERVGVIEPGATADLLLVDGNPLEDISVTSKIVTVVQGGAVVERL